MLIESKLKGPLSVPLVVRDNRTPAEIKKDAEEGVTPKSVTGLVAPHQLYIIHPGFNNMPHEQWELAAPEIKEYLDRKDLDVTFSRKDKEREGARESMELWDLPAKDAREVIRKTFNMRDIKVWLTHERVSSEMRHLIQMQKEGIESGVDPWADEGRGRN
jgi:hypothetical protein